jgi:AcrR family transcriptional regulator
VKPAAATSLRTRTLEEALRIIDAEGLEALSIRRLADVLGVKGASLYHHFKDKDEILDGVAGLALADLRPPEDESLPWVDWLLQMTRRYRDALLVHPNLLPLILGRHNRRAGEAVYDYAARKLTAVGIPDAYRLPLIDSLEAYATGGVLFRMDDTSFDVGCRALLRGFASEVGPAPGNYLSPAG